jgi:hypothetical protein
MSAEATIPMLACLGISLACFWLWCKLAVPQRNGREYHREQMMSPARIRRKTPVSGDRRNSR